jgi:hypothetical protein
MAKQKVLEQLGGLGHAPTSGPVLNALQEVDRRFDSLHAQGENHLLLEGTRIRDERRANADRLMAGLPELALSEAGLNEEQFRSMAQALTSGMGTLGSINLGNRGLDLNVASQFGDMVNQIVGMDEMRMRDAVTIAAMLPQMQNENIRLALQLFGNAIPQF